jgi:hypothetical protein
MSDLIEELRQNVRKLDADGPEGFEGLVATVLTAVTGRSFSIARAGTQHGRDGQSTLDGGSVVFEAKRYDDKIPNDKIFTKLYEVGIDLTTPIDLFVAASTGPIDAQQAMKLRAGGRLYSIGILLLAWPETGLSEFATVLAMAADESCRFIAKYTAASETDLAAQLAAVRAHAQFAERSGELAAIFRQPSIAPAYALADNIAYLTDAFSSKSRARAVFGQELCPGDATMPMMMERAALRDKVAAAVFRKPDGNIVGIVGSDGNGKSWIFAQAWHYETSKPLTIIIVPQDINFSPSEEGIRDLLIAKLQTQSKEESTPEGKGRWLRFFKRWGSSRDIDNPRLVVLLDGINQREQLEWRRIIDILTSLLDRIGGRLVVSCRTAFYENHIRKRLASHVDVVEVPEWTVDELDQLLRKWDTCSSALDPAVAKSLRNPRLFGVAAALFKGAEILHPHELSVNRLLFEHIYSDGAVIGQPTSPKEFAGDICAHAEEIVQRLKVSTEAGWNEFHLASGAGTSQAGTSVSERFVVTAGGRFFEVIDDDPRRYLLKEEGLPLAFGLAVLRAAREAHRQKRNVSEALASILDPISALDNTCDILLAAILAAVLEGSPATVTASLVRAFVDLQNLDATRTAEFRHLFARSPDAFLAALEDGVLEERSPNLSWLTDAIVAMREEPSVEQSLRLRLRKWISMYSMAPDRRTFRRPDEDPGEYTRALTKKSEELEAAVRSLSTAEVEIFGAMVKEERGDHAKLGRLAFELLAGRPLTSYADCFRARCLAVALNPGHIEYEGDFQSLLRFNIVDWPETTRAIHEISRVLRAPDTSITGKWALASLLFATGDETDTAEAQRLVEELRGERGRDKGWHLRETFCASDPCDPSSEEPSNLEETEKKYIGINPAELFCSMGRSQVDMYFEDARVGLVRFRPTAAIAVLESFAQQLLTRQGLPAFRIAVNKLKDDTAGLQPSIAKQYLRKALEIAQLANDGGDEHGEAWAAAQHALCVAFPHMGGKAQLSALLAHPKDRSILFELGYLFEPIPGDDLEQALARAIQDNQALLQFRVLCFAAFSSSPLSARTKKLILESLHSNEGQVRIVALLLIIWAGDLDLLSGFVKSTWDANSTGLDPASDKTEVAYGSEALAIAAEKHLISIESCIKRINLCAFESLVRRCGSAAAMLVAERLNVCLQKALDFNVVGNLPDIEQNFEGSYWPHLLRVREKDVTDETFTDWVERQNEAPEAWYQRQKRNDEVAAVFERDLSKAGAELIIQAVTRPLVAAVQQVRPELVDSWAEIFLELDVKGRANVHNFAVLVAGALADHSPSVSAALFKHLRTGAPYVRVTVGKSRVELAATVTWDSASNVEIKRLCYERLDRCVNDHAIATEVLAAIRAKRLEVVQEYVLERRNRVEPAHRARALAVAGFCPDMVWAVETIEMFADAEGVLGEAYLGAKFAMDRFRWSRHWAEKMRAAADPVEFWRYSVLLVEILDGRFAGDDFFGGNPGPVAKRFGTTFGDVVRRRLEKWNSKRSKALFGAKLPKPNYISGYEGAPLSV